MSAMTQKHKENTHPSPVDVRKNNKFELYLIFYKAGFCLYCQDQPETLAFLLCPRGVIRPWTLWGSKAIYCTGDPPPFFCASGLLLELITLSGETKYWRHIMSKKAHSITKLLSTARLLPFITCERWNSLLVKGNGCFTTLPQINTCRHFPFSSLLQKSNYTEEMLTINRLVR